MMNVRVLKGHFQKLTSPLLNTVSSPKRKCASDDEDSSPLRQKRSHALKNLQSAAAARASPPPGPSSNFTHTAVDNQYAFPPPPTL